MLLKLLLQLVSPRSRSDMLQYEDEAGRCTLCSVEISLPNLNALLPNKQFLERVYNRFDHLSHLCSCSQTYAILVPQVPQ